MKKILVINSSTRIENSQSRFLTALFIENWGRKHPNDVVKFREIGMTPISHIDNKWITASFTKPENRTPENQRPLKLSNELVKELHESDVIILGVPMYNWGIPSTLKSYIDQIMRINETWKFKSGKPDSNYVGLLKNKKMFILSARGDTGYGPGEQHAHMNFQTTYLQFIFKTLGIHDITVISLDNEEFGGEVFEKTKFSVQKQIEDMFLKN
ncbi:FMN-dependent NADH-azoreductase [Sphingobacterium cellulitidis]|uniref:FMN-dependent NADH-azoreductase n=1 Tax=Sphingobacterium cellulitidis TaxID=1768011 RepID=UPI000B93FEBA|nr:NAD(P)H dehydrogenase [Sphingobacterium cellulitidis]